MKFPRLPIKPALALLFVLPLVGLLVVAGAAGRAGNGRELPPTAGLEPPAEPAPTGAQLGAGTLLPSKVILPSWQRLTEKDVEEAMEEGDAAEDVLRSLRGRLDAYAQAKGTPLPGPSLLPAAALHTGPLSGPPAAAAAVPAPLREPTIQEVHRAAIRYAEVMPEKIRRWRALSQLRNFIPRFTLGLDRDRDSTIASSTSGGKTSFTVGPEDESLSVDFGFTWDLANLVWDPAQTSIDVRSRLMVQLRRDVLEETTRLYFERRRLQAEFAAHPADDPPLQQERALRIEELTAQLDALTGGLYSDTPLK